MVKIQQIVENSEYNTLMTAELKNIFGDNDFTNDVMTIINDCLDDLATFDYSTWLYVNDLTDINIFIKFISRWIKKKYKYFEFYKNRWSISKGTEFGNIETTERTYGRERDVNINNERTFSNTHNSTTNMTYDTDFTDTSNSSTNNYGVTETAPLGASVNTINTPDSKAQNTNTSTDTLTRDRSDTQNTTVNSGDNSTDNFTSTSSDDFNDTENITKNITNGVEVLKAIKYNNLSIVDVISSIVDRTIYEFNVVI